MNGMGGEQSDEGPMPTADLVQRWLRAERDPELEPESHLGMEGVCRPADVDADRQLARRLIGNRTPLQENGHDCGVYMLAIAWCLIRRVPLRAAQHADAVKRCPDHGVCGC